MPIPASLNWLPYFLSKLSLIWQGGTGACEAASAAYAIMLRGMIQGYPPIQLSPRYILWWGQSVHDFGGMGIGLPVAAAHGVCLESLMPMPPYIGIDTTTQAYSDLTWAAVTTPPSPAATADAANHIVTGWSFLMTDATPADVKAKAQASLAAGYPITFFDPPNHELCAMGYDDGGLIGLDSRSQNGLPGFYRSWAQINPFQMYVCTGVLFRNAVQGPPLPFPPDVVQPPPTGNSQMLIDTIKTQAATVNSDASGLVLGAVSQARIDQIKADNAILAANINLLVPDGVAPAPGTGWRIVQPDLSQYVDATGTTWKARDWNGNRMALLRNGNFEGITPSEAYYPGSGAVVYCKNTSGAWWIKWSGSAWVYMAAGEIPPGYAPA